MLAVRFSPCVPTLSPERSLQQAPCGARCFICGRMHMKQGVRDSPGSSTARTGPRSGCRRPTTPSQAKLPKPNDPVYKPADVHAVSASAARPWLPWQVRSKRELAACRLAASRAPLNAMTMLAPSAMTGCRACSAGAGPRGSQPDGSALAHLNPLALRPQLLGMLPAVSTVPKPSLLWAGDSRMAAFLSQGQYRGI